MFNDSKYTRWYYSIINKRITVSCDKTLHQEKHHIIPRSLGGSNKKNNLVLLTPKEHFICHRLLVKMTSGHDKTKMSYAIRLMCTIENQYQQRYKLTSWMYEKIIEETRKYIPVRSGSDNPYYGGKHSEEVRKKMKEKRALQIIPKGRKVSDATKVKLREANKRQFEKQDQIDLRKKKSKELWDDPAWRQKYKGNTGKTWYTNGIKNGLFPSDDNIPAGWTKGLITCIKNRKGKK